MTRFEEIYQAYFSDVYRYILGLSGDGHIADEITGETFFKAMGAIDGFRGDCDVRVWLCQIAKNTYNSYLKKANRTDSLENMNFSEWPSQDETPETQFIRHSEAERIRDVLHEMGEPYKEVFMWRVFAELSFRQIGQIFGKSENWACVTYHRAKKVIKTRLEENKHEE